MEALRLSEDDVRAMRARAGQWLPPEGAQSWHQLDVKALLDERDILRAEIEVARQMLLLDVPDADPDAALSVLVDLWKEHGSKVFSRRIVKGLQATVTAAERNRVLLEGQLDESRQETRDEKMRVTELLIELSQSQDGAQRERERTLALLQAEEAEQVRLREQIISLSDDLLNCQQRNDRDIAMAQAQVQQRLSVVVEYLRHALAAANE